MSFFANQLQTRINEAKSSIAAARAEGDDYLVAVRASELADLHRLARDNGLDLDGEPGSC